MQRQYELAMGGVGYSLLLLLLLPEYWIT